MAQRPPSGCRRSFDGSAGRRRQWRGHRRGSRRSLISLLQQRRQEDSLRSQANREESAPNGAGRGHPLVGRTRSDAWRNNGGGGCPQSHAEGATRAPNYGAATKPPGAQYRQHWVTERGRTLGCLGDFASDGIHAKSASAERFRLNELEDYFVIVFRHVEARAEANVRNRILEREVDDRLR
jgi:hypothetical protein